MKKFLARFLIICSVIVICIIFGDKNILWSDDIYDRVSNMTSEDIVITIVDENTINVQNLIQGEDLLYKWSVKNYVYGVTLGSGERLFLEDEWEVEFTYEDLTYVEIQAIVSYDGYTYTSNTFHINEDGSVYQSTDVDTSSVEATETIEREVSDVISLAFVCFLVVMSFFYYVVPKNYQWIILLSGSVYFYVLSGLQYMIFILLSSIVTFLVARKMSEESKLCAVAVAVENQKKSILKKQMQQRKRTWLSVGLIVTLGVMVVLKYTDFMLENLNDVLGTNMGLLYLVMPLGLSFYTFMLLAYLLDVYRGKYEAEEKFSRFFLFVSFFPQVSQGPISRYDQVSSQLKEEHYFSYENYCMGVQRILWGFFVKLVLADRLAIFVDWVYGSYGTQSWLLLIGASLGYSIQIYADFYSSMEVAIGTAQLFGIKLAENFMRPYFSTNMPEFWRRWHITLGTWFKDYVFYPISISKKVMKFSIKTRKKYGVKVSRIVAAIPPIMGVWILTGLWHGSSWKFVAWGLFHGVLILLSTVFSQTVEDVLNRIGICTERLWYKLLQMFKVFILCTIGRVFFRAESVAVARVIFLRILTLAQADMSDGIGMVESLAALGFDIEDAIILGVAIIILLIVSILQERFGSVRELINKRHICIRWMIWILLLFAVILFGKYGLGTSTVFIYDAF